MTRRARWRRTAGAAAALVAVAAAPALTLPPVRLLAFPDRAGEFVVRPGEVVTRAFVASDEVAILDAPASLARADERRSLIRGTALIAFGQSGVADAPPVVWCEELDRGSWGKRQVNGIGFGLAGALRSTRLDVRFCLYGATPAVLDRAFLIGARGKLAEPFAIPPIAYHRAGAEAQVGAEALVRYAGTDAGGAAFDRELWRANALVAGAGERQAVPVVALPAVVTLGDARLVLLAVDAKTGAARLRVERGLGPGYLSVGDSDGR